MNRLSGSAQRGGTTSMHQVGPGVPATPAGSGVPATPAGSGVPATPAGSGGATDDGQPSGEALRRLADDLARSNADLAEFAYVAAHDLRSPLGIISGYTQLLGELTAVADSPEASDLVAHIHAGVDRMQALIDDLLAWSSIDGEPMTPVPVDLARLAVETCLPLVHASATGGTIELGALPILRGDEVQLRQLLDNLTTNALKFVPGGRAPALSLSAERDGAGWIVTLADNGVGVADEDRGRIFGMYQRVHGENGFPGTGIGLAICHRVVERHRGRIWVEANDPEGTRVRFWLPAD